MTEEIYTCEFSGCRKQFEHRMQRYCHEKRFHPDFVNKKQENSEVPFKVTDDGKFSCIKCIKNFSPSTSYAIYIHFYVRYLFQLHGN